MAAIPKPERTTLTVLNESCQRPPEPRPHMGISQLGHHCDRFLWLSFRLAFIEQHDGRMARLFRRGQLEEAQVIGDLRCAGIVVNDRDENGEQFRVDFGSHVSGSMDGVIESGVIEAPKAVHVLEVKTHSRKSFEELVKSGVEAAKPQHYVQMLAYCLGKKIDRALYYAVCKDDDRVYVERVKLDRALAQRYVDRGKRLALAERMPEPCPNGSEDWYLCKWCPGHDLCWGSKTTKEANCRTCAHATPREDSTWHCARWDDVIPFEAQLQGCESHCLHPDLVPWKMLDSGDDLVAKYEIDGVPVLNGSPDVGVFSSVEILNDPSGCAKRTVRGY